MPASSVVLWDNWKHNTTWNTQSLPCDTVEKNPFWHSLYVETFFCICWNLSATHTAVQHPHPPWLHSCPNPTSSTAPNNPLGVGYLEDTARGECCVWSHWHTTLLWGWESAPPSVQPRPCSVDLSWGGVGLYHRCKTLQGIHHYLEEQVLSFLLNVQHLLPIQYWIMTIIHFPFSLFSLGYWTIAVPQSARKHHPPVRPGGLQQRWMRISLHSLFPAVLLTVLHPDSICRADPALLWSSRGFGSDRSQQLWKSPPDTPHCCAWQVSCYCLELRDLIYHLHGQSGWYLY